jgi:WD40 repeat protein
MAEIRALALSRAGDRLAAADDNGRVVIWDCAAWRAVAQFESGDTVNAAVFSADGSELITGGNSEFVQFWGVADGRRTRQLPRGGSWISALALSSDGRRLAAGGGQGEVKLWELASGALTPLGRHDTVTAAGMYTHASTVTALLFTPDGARLISAGDDDAIHNMILPRASPRPTVSSSEEPAALTPPTSP